MSDASFNHWHPLTIEGHADEIALLLEHAPDASLAEQGMCDGVPCVVGYQEGRIVVCCAGAQPVWGVGRVECRVDGPSATIMQGPAHATHLSVPAALSMETIANHWNYGSERTA